MRRAGLPDRRGGGEREGARQGLGRLGARIGGGGEVEEHPEAVVGAVVQAHARA
jgi:hypothetical protein